MKTGKKYTTANPGFFPIFHMSTNFHSDQTNNKEKKWEYGPLKWFLSSSTEKLS